MTHSWAETDADPTVAAKLSTANIFQTRYDMFSVLLALPLHSKPVCANAAIHAEGTAKTAASVGILGVELAHDARFGSNHTLQN
jgi:hypothetical protein